jgi:hypothetical protein
MDWLDRAVVSTKNVELSPLTADELFGYLA